MTSDQGLRERKKLATREAMSQAAWHLMIEHGISAVTPEAVAEAAGVSPRTFRNYFWAPEQAVVDGIVQRATVVVKALQARPADEPVWDSLVHVLPDTLPTIVGSRNDIISLMRAREEDPGLLGQHLAALERLHELLVDAIAERTGTDPRRDLAPRLLALVAADAMSAATAIWALGDVDDDLPTLVRLSLSELRAGLPSGAIRPTVTSTSA
jgi:AcrR family transcriptional regulator